MIDINTDEVFDTRDLIEWLEDEDNKEDDPERYQFMKRLASELIDNCVDYSYGETVIPKSEFTEYAKQLAEDVFEMPSDLRWPLTCIDWDEAASELLIDYTEIELDGENWFVR